MSAPESKKQLTSDRPEMPADYGIKRGKTGQLPWNWVSERMEKSHNYWVCSTRPDGRPHAMPVWGVWLGDTLYFGTNRDSVKGRNLSADPRVAVHLESGDEAVMIESVVEETHDMETLIRIAAAFSQKYPGYNPDPDFGPEVAMYAVRPRRVMAWLENDFVRSATRWRFEEEKDR